MSNKINVFIILTQLFYLIGFSAFYKSEVESICATQKYLIMSRASSPPSSYHSDCSIGSSRKRVNSFDVDNYHREPHKLNTELEIHGNHHSPRKFVQDDLSDEAFPPPPPPLELNDDNNFLANQYVQNATRQTNWNPNASLQMQYIYPHVFQQPYAQASTSQNYHPNLINQLPVMPENQFSASMISNQHHVGYNQVQIAPPNVQYVLPPAQPCFSNQQQYDTHYENSQACPVSQPYYYANIPQLQQMYHAAPNTISNHVQYPPILVPSQPPCVPPHDTGKQLLNGNKQDPGKAFINYNSCNLTPRDVSGIIPEFDPSNKECVSVRKWIAMCEKLKSVYNFSETILLFASIKKLKGNANLWYESVANVIESWDVFRDMIVREFDKSKDIADVHFQLANKKRKSSESLTEFIYNIRKISSEIDLDDQTIIKYVLSGLNEHDEKIKYALAVQNFKSVSELIDRVKKFENVSYYKSDKTTRHENTYYRSEHKSINRENYDNRNKNNCLKCNSNNHSTRYCPKGSVCSFCKEPGHYETKCLKKNPPNNIKRIENADCEYVKQVLINDIPVRAFVDLGSDCVTVIKSVVPRLNIIVRDYNKILKGFGNSSVKILGISEIKLEIDNIIFHVEAYVVDDICQTDPVMIGRSALDRNGIIIIKHFKNLQILKIPDYNFIIKHNTSNNKFEINENENRDVDNFIINNKLTDEQLSKPNEQSIKKCNEKTQTAIEENGDVIPIVDENINYDENDNLNISSLFVESNCVYRLNGANDTLLTDDITDEMFLNCINKTIDKNYIAELKLLISKYRKSFAFNMKEVGLTDKTEIKINLTNDTPVFYRPYRLSVTQREKVSLQINELLDLNIIRPSNSDFASPIVVVKKKQVKIESVLIFGK